MDLGLRGMRALVTGSTSGIGKAIAVALAEEGAEVVIHGRNEARAIALAKDIEKLGTKVTIALGDLSTNEGAQDVAKKSGPVNILVNNAGIYEQLGWFQETPEQWTQWYENNVISMLRLNQLLVPQMKTKAWGRVIAIGSVVASQPNPGMPGYSATKGANVNMAISLAHALAGTGVTSNVVSPGIILTEGVEELFDKMQIPQDRAAREKAALEWAPNVAARRPGYPAEVAALVAFLCSKKADFITGQNIRIDGGHVATVS